MTRENHIDDCCISLFLETSGSEVQTLFTFFKFLPGKNEILGPKHESDGYRWNILLGKGLFNIIELSHNF